MNFSKPDSLFNHGMKVLVYSERKVDKEDVGWHWGCSNICYYANGIWRENLKYYKSYYTLTFTHEFEFENDLVYFAYCYPYTYTELKNYLLGIERDPEKNKFCVIRTLCTTLAGNKCDYVTITSWKPGNKKGVIISARVHPGESVGSWMMKGVLDLLTDPEDKEAQMLWDNYIFKIIPMLNPDGVINGNYRCSLAGCDLNWWWKTPSKVLHPTIYHLKQMIA